MAIGEFGLLPPRAVDAAANENAVRMKQHNLGYIRLKKPAASSLATGFSNLAMMMLCR